MKYLAHYDKTNDYWHCCYQIHEGGDMVSMCYSVSEVEMRKLAASMQATYDKELAQAMVERDRRYEGRERPIPREFYRDQ